MKEPQLSQTQMEWLTVGEGIRRKVLPPGQELMSIVIELQKGALGPAHSHPHEQLTFVLEGAVEFVVEGERTVVHKHEQLRVPGGAVHSLTALQTSLLLETFTPLREDLLKG